MADKPAFSLAKRLLFALFGVVSVVLIALWWRDEHRSWEAVLAFWLFLGQIVKGLLDWLAARRAV